MAVCYCPSCGHAYGPTETAMLGVFERGDGWTVADLAVRLGCSRPMASNTAKALCLKGELTRSPENLPAGGRLYVYSLTHKQVSR